ncbi:hypothetical protein ACHAXT_006958 [Thalassiosira profunda]
MASLPKPPPLSTPHGPGVVPNHKQNQAPPEGDVGIAQKNANQLQNLPIIAQRALLQPTTHQQNTGPSIPLQSLPLRRSTLTALLRSGLSTTGDIMNIMQRGGDPNVEMIDGNATNTTNPASGGEGGIGNFAQEIGCSAAQAADYAHEIDDALVSVGLPRATVGDNGAAPGADGDVDMATQQPAFPATAAAILRSRANNNQTRQIVSFSQTLDTLLGGGFALSELTEIAGLPGVGKTQLAMQLCVDARLPSKFGGVEGCAVVVDAEGSWSSAAGGDRLWSMAGAMVDHVKSSALRKMKARQARAEADGAQMDGEEMEKLLPSWLTPEFILEGIHIFRVHDEASQTCTLYNLPKFLSEMEEKGTPVKLVVIDSLAFHYRVASSASSSATSSGSKSTSLSTTHNLTRMAAFLMELASEFELAVVAMNHLTTRIEKDDQSNASTTKLVPALGESWAHSVTSRLMIDHYRPPHAANSTQNSTGEVRVCTLVKSPHKPSGTALFMITDKGIRAAPPQLLQAQSVKRQRTD